jgi:hypothetical protein
VGYVRESTTAEIVDLELGIDLREAGGATNCRGLNSVATELVR